MTVWLRASASTLALMLLATSCSEPSLTDYAEEVELLVTTMNTSLDAIDKDLDSSEPSVEVIQAYGRTGSKSAPPSWRPSKNSCVGTPPTSGEGSTSGSRG